MTQINGITDFLTQAGTQFKIFDMGRRIEEVPPATFLSFEMSETPWPFALQQQAWLGIIIWTDESDPDEPDPADQGNELVIWFLRFPLDAAGKLTSGIREDFVLRLINTDGKPAQDDDNPYGFKPKQEHMAYFHAKAARLLDQPASSYYEHARDYFAGKPGYDQWTFVGFQGIADIAVRLDENDNTALLCNAIPEIPAQPFEALAQCLEHQRIDTQLSQTIAGVLQKKLNLGDNSQNESADNNAGENSEENNDANFISLCIRALSNAEDQAQLNTQIAHILNTRHGSHPEILASISGRCWLTLRNESTLALYLEALSRCTEGQDFFNLVVVDLINVPGMQEGILKAVKSPGRSESLSRSIGELFKTFS